MASADLEQRVATLETQLERLQLELRTSQMGKFKDWRRTIGAFTDDEGMQLILHDAMQLREADRRKVRTKKAPIKRASSNKSPSTKAPSRKAAKREPQ
jgi:hypothetical protein